MSLSGSVCLQQPNHLQQIDQQHPVSSESWIGRIADVLVSHHCMFPTNALNGPLGSSSNLLGPPNQSIPGPTDFSSTPSSASSFLNRSHGSAGLSSLFSKEAGRPVLDQHNSKDAGFMPPTLNAVSSNNYIGGPTPNVGTIGAGSTLHKFSRPEGPLLSENEFPSLIGSGRNSQPSTYTPSTSYQHQPFKDNVGGLLQSSPSSSSIANRTNYANFVKNADSLQPQTNSVSSEFHIQNEDFPALPGAQQNDTQSSSSGMPVTTGPEALNDARFPGDMRQLPSHQPRKGIQTQPDGLVTGIPGGMLNDQFGMAGLLTFLRAIETDPGIVALALGHDLTTLGLNLNAAEKTLYQNFGGPWADVPCRMQDVDYHVPEEYMTNVHVREKLPPIKLNRYPDDVLFFLFYNCPGEVFQMAAAVELYSRDWRYHKDERVWLTRAPGQVTEQTGTYERGMYYVFDFTTWRKLPKEMTLEYSRLEERPLLPPQLQPHPQQGSTAPNPS